MKRAIPLFLLLITGLNSLKAQVVELVTEKGIIRVQLYKDTPLHTANFLENVKAGKYKGVLFHRVIRDFMVQTGDPNSVNAKPGELLGADIGKKTIPAEILPHHYHKRGALAAARQPDETNPERRSSQYQFYIVDGRDYTPGMLKSLENNQNRPKRYKVADSLLVSMNDTLSDSYRTKKQLDSLMKAKDYKNADKILGQLKEKTDAIIGEKNLLKFSEQQIADYTTLGGVPNLDGKYTVFGEVIDGLEFIDAISGVETDKNSRPFTNIALLDAKLLE